MVFGLRRVDCFVDAFEWTCRRTVDFLMIVSITGVVGVFWIVGYVFFVCQEVGDR